MGDLVERIIVTVGALGCINVVLYLLYRLGRRRSWANIVLPFVGVAAAIALAPIPIYAMNAREGPAVALPLLLMFGSAIAWTVPALRRVARASQERRAALDAVDARKFDRFRKFEVAVVIGFVVTAFVLLALGEHQATQTTVIIFVLVTGILWIARTVLFRGNSDTKEHQ